MGEHKTKILIRGKPPIWRIRNAEKRQVLEQIGVTTGIGESEDEFAGDGVEIEEGGIELTTGKSFDKIAGMKGKIEMVDKEEMEKANRSQTKAEALATLAKMNAMLQKMPISEAVKKERFERLQDKLNSFGWLGLCDKKTFAAKADGCWTQLKLVDPDSDEARAIP